MLLTKDGGEVIVPKTLDDARKLIGTPPPPGSGLDDGTNTPDFSLRSASPEQQHDPTAADRSPLLSFISGTGRSGRSAARDHSADSARSSNAGSVSRRGGEERRPSEQLTELGQRGSSHSTTTVTATGVSLSPSVTSPPIIDSMRNLGNSLNPMARLSAGIGGFRGFGRSAAATPAATPPAVSSGGRGVVDGGDLATVCISVSCLFCLSLTHTLFSFPTLFFSFLLFPFSSTPLPSPSAYSSFPLIQSKTASVARTKRWPG